MSGKIVQGMCSNDRGFCEKIGYCGCDAYASPDAWSRRGGCPLSTIPTPKAVETQKKVNALKASKRAARGK
jgi:hypothetical protein